eukprot:4090266-Amphidinium_carterae.1
MDSQTNNNFDHNKWNGNLNAVVNLQDVCQHHIVVSSTPLQYTFDDIHNLRFVVSGRDDFAVDVGSFYLEKASLVELSRQCE